MKNTSLKKYVSMRQSLTAEKTTLEARLHAVNQALGGALKTAGAKQGRKRKKFSAAARAAISAAQKARWAKIKAGKK